MFKKRILGTLVVMTLLMLNLRVVAQNEGKLWEAWAQKEVTDLGDDHTGTTFSLSEDVRTPDGRASIRMTPSGKAEENKLAFPVTGADLAVWGDHAHLVLEVYLPSNIEQAPNTFFMGMGDVTGAWQWVDGGFGKPVGELNTGWNRIKFPITGPMKAISATGRYVIYMSFFYVDGQGAKKQLSQAFHIGNTYLIGESGASVGGGTEVDGFAAEVEALLKLDDEALLEAIARQTFDYFWEEANPTNGLIKDRSTPDSASSIAAVGFGLSAIPIAVDRGWITHQEGYDRVLLTLKTFENAVQGHEGFYFHFVDMKTGERVWDSEVSTIDTSLFIMGALTAGEYFKNTEVESLASALYERINWVDFAPDGTLVSMGWKPETGYLGSRWSHFDEGLLLYLLAMGSPTHPIPPEAWDQIERPVNVDGEYIFLPGETLFVYQYPLAWIDLRDREDRYANYFNNTQRACERNRQFAQRESDQVKTYQNGVWGISASDGPRGYKAYGATGPNSDGTAAPYASIACLPFTPEASLESIRGMLATYGPKVWAEYGFVSAFNAVVEWYSHEHIGIDQGDILLMIANYQDGFVWKLIAQNQYLQAGLKKAGFEEKRSDYAVTPAFLKEKLK